MAQKGKVKWFDGKKGYGFIQQEGVPEDIFVHYSSIQTEQPFKTLDQGAEVEFDLIQGQKGLQAQNVTPTPPSVSLI